MTGRLLVAAALLLTLSPRSPAQDSGFSGLINVYKSLPESSRDARRAALTRALDLGGAEALRWFASFLDDEDAPIAELNLAIQSRDPASAEWRDLMVKALKTPANARVHATIALHFASQENSAALAILVDVHRFGDRAQKIVVINALSQHFAVDDYYLPVLAPHLSPQSNPDVRHQALRALAAQLDRRFFRHVASTAPKDQHVARRADWILWSAKFDTQEALSTILTLATSSPDPLVERAFLHAARVFKNADAVKWYRTAAASAKIAFHRRAAATFFAENPVEHMAMLVLLAADSDTQTAGIAVRALAVVEDERAARALEQKIGHHDTAVAADALRSFGAASGMSPAAVERIRDVGLRSKSYELRIAAMEILASHDPAAHRDVFLGNAVHDQRPVRNAAYDALTHCRTNDVVDFLIVRLEHEEGRNALELAAALYDLTNFDWGTKSERWRKWWTNTRGGYQLPPKPLKRPVPSAEYATYYGVAVKSERVVFVIDVSGSMDAQTRDKTRLQTMKDNLGAVLDSLNDRTRFTIIAFNDGLIPWSPTLVRALGADVTKARKWVDGLSAAGGTNVYDSLDRALNIEEADTIFLLSDGAPSAGRVTDMTAIVEEISTRNQFRRVRINTILVAGDRATRGFMRNLAERNYGEFVETK